MIILLVRAIQQHMEYSEWSFRLYSNEFWLWRPLWAITPCIREVKRNPKLVSSHTLFHENGLCFNSFTRVGFLDAVSESWDSYARSWLFEATRVVNHLLAIGCHMADVGAVSYILWVLISVKSFSIFERLTGIRLHARIQSQNQTLLNRTTFPVMYGGEPLPQFWYGCFVRPFSSEIIFRGYKDYCDRRTPKRIPRQFRDQCWDLPESVQIPEWIVPDTPTNQYESRTQTPVMF